MHSLTLAGAEWSRWLNNDNPIPPDTRYVEARFIINLAVEDDGLEVDKVMAVIQSTNIPDAGPHPPWVPHVDEV